MIDKPLQDTPHWKIYSRIDARRLREPTTYIVDKFIESGSLNIVYGNPGGFKSMVMLDLAVCVALVTNG